MVGRWTSLTCPAQVGCKPLDQLAMIQTQLDNLGHSGFWIASIYGALTYQILNLECTPPGMRVFLVEANSSSFVSGLVSSTKWLNLFDASRRPGPLCNLSKHGAVSTHNILMTAPNVLNYIWGIEQDGGKLLEEDTQGINTFIEERSTRGGVARGCSPQPVWMTLQDASILEEVKSFESSQSGRASFDTTSTPESAPGWLVVLTTVC